MDVYVIEQQMQQQICPGGNITPVAGQQGKCYYK